MLYFEEHFVYIFGTVDIVFDMLVPGPATSRAQLSIKWRTIGKPRDRRLFQNFLIICHCT